MWSHVEHIQAHVVRDGYDIFAEGKALDIPDIGACLYCLTSLLNFCRAAGVLEAGWKPLRTRQRGSVARAPSAATDAQVTRRCECKHHCSPVWLQARMGAVLKVIRNSKDSWPFHHPVDKEQVGQTPSLHCFSLSL